MPKTFKKDKSKKQQETLGVVKLKQNSSKQNEKDKQRTDESFPTNWDVDKYRRDYESEEHWQLRRCFMQKHKKKFPENKVVCLAQVFINMEFMGCKYPAETMLLVAELSKGIVEEFRASRVNSLKRTFVSATEAAEVRAKGRRITRVHDNVKGNNNKKQQYIMNCKNSNISFGKLRKNENDSIQNPHSSRTAQENLLFDELKYGEFVLYLKGNRNCIRQSCERCNIKYLELEKEAENQTGFKKVEIYTNDEKIAEAYDNNIKNAKFEAFLGALNFLQDHCYSIKQNSLRDTIKIGKSDDNQVICDVTKAIMYADSEDGKVLDSTNKGYKMMKMMGWTGGGLGLQQQGRQYPVSYLLKNNRAGLGNESHSLNRNYFTRMLQNYVNSDDIRELSFESKFTKSERAMLHEIAQRYHLKSTSYGQSGERRLIISKKIPDVRILKEVLLEKNPRYLDRYSVHVPLSKQSLFPDHSAKLFF